MQVIVCPNCLHEGTSKDFGMSLADECWCPKCNEAFLFFRDEGEDEDDDD